MNLNELLSLILPFSLLNSPSDGILRLPTQDDSFCFRPLMSALSTALLLHLYLRSCQYLQRENCPFVARVLTPRLLFTCHILLFKVPSLSRSSKHLKHWLYHSVPTRLFSNDPVIFPLLISILWFSASFPRFQQCSLSTMLNHTSLAPVCVCKYFTYFFQPHIQTPINILCSSPLKWDLASTFWGWY